MKYTINTLNEFEKYVAKLVIKTRKTTNVLVNPNCFILKSEAEVMDEVMALDAWRTYKMLDGDKDAVKIAIKKLKQEFKGFVKDITFNVTPSLESSVLEKLEDSLRTIRDLGLNFKQKINIVVADNLLEYDEIEGIISADDHGLCQDNTVYIKSFSKDLHNTIVHEAIHSWDNQFKYGINSQGIFAELLRPDVKDTEMTNQDHLRFLYKIGHGDFMSLVDYKMKKQFDERRKVALELLVSLKKSSKVNYFLSTTKNQYDYNVRMNEKFKDSIKTRITNAITKPKYPKLQVFISKIKTFFK